MQGRVIQGFFVGGGRLAPATTPGQAVVMPGAVSGAPGHPVQRRAAPGRPPLVHAVAPAGERAGGAPAASLQRFGGDGSFAVDPTRVGLVRGGGTPLPRALLAKMEAAFGADFSGVRVHVGPQASRIGAIAFTTGSDLYFAPGHFQPDSVRGQQLIGHELAHVVQQRAGRVRGPASGVAVVQDRMLEAEADRQGLRAAAHRMPSAASTSRGPASSVQPHRWGTVQRSMDLAASAPGGNGGSDDEREGKRKASHAEEMTDWSDSSLDDESHRRVFKRSHKKSKQPRLYEKHKGSLKTTKFHSSKGLNATVRAFGYDGAKQSSANTHVLISRPSSAKKKTRVMVNSTTANAITAASARQKVINLGAVNNYFRGQHVHTEMFLILVLTQGDETKIDGCMNGLKLVVDKPICPDCVPYVRRAAPDIVDDGLPLNNNDGREGYPWKNPFALYRAKQIEIPENPFTDDDE